MIKTSICLNLDYSSKIWSDQIVLDMGQKISSKYSFMIKTSIVLDVEYIDSVVLPASTASIIISLGFSELTESFISE